MSAVPVVDLSDAIPQLIFRHDQHLLHQRRLPVRRNLTSAFLHCGRRGKGRKAALFGGSEIVWSVPVVESNVASTVVGSDVATTVEGSR